MLSLNNRNDVLIEEYENEREIILRGLDNFFDNEELEHFWNHCSNFITKDNERPKIPHLSYIRGFMTKDQVLKALDVKYWRKLLEETRVLNYVSSKEREKWQDQLNQWLVPEFTIEAIRPTMMDFMRDLPSLFAQRLREAHGMLSTAHKTNKAQRFDKRIIFQVFYPETYGYNLSDVKAGALNDIRSTISQLLGGEQLNHWDTRQLIRNLIDGGNYGDWVKLDQYIALRIYKKGTCHMEIHPRLLDQLNNILSDGSLPDLSAEWYTKEEKKKRTEFHDLAHIVISNELRDAIRRNINNGHEFWDYIEHGTYDCEPVLKHVWNTGIIPEFKSHQFYPTPKHIAYELQSYIPDDVSILEPSAGTGRLINGLSPDCVTCLDIADLHCEILKAKGFKKTECKDFLKYDTSNKFDCIVMNPPYSKQRSLLHIDKAKDHLNDGGFILAIVPTGKIREDMEVLKDFTGGFDNTNINTSLVRIKK